MSQPEPTTEKCAPPCENCRRHGCCPACAFSDTFTLEQSALANFNSNSPNTPELHSLRRDSPFDEITFWCDRDFAQATAAAKAGEDESQRVVKRRRSKVGVPIYPDGKPCPHWVSKFYDNPVTGKMEIAIVR